MVFESWTITILKIIFVIIGGHLAITILLPALKRMLSPSVKREEFIPSVIAILIFYVAVLVLKFILEFLIETESKFLGYGNALLPGTEVIITVVPYVLYFMIAAVIVAGLKK